MSRLYRILPHTAEVAIEAGGVDFGQALANAARAMFSVMVDLRTVRIREWTEVEAVSESLNSLLVEWLNELVYRWETAHLLLRDFQPCEVDINHQRYMVRMLCGGERFDESRHEPKNHVKAVAYHAATVRRVPDGYIVHAVLDV